MSTEKILHDALTAIAAACTAAAQQIAAEAQAQPAAQAPAQPPAAQAASTQAQPVQPDIMDPATFAAQAQIILQRHGGDQSPLLPLLQKWGVQQPVNQLQPGQYAGFLAEMRAAYGEAA